MLRLLILSFLLFTTTALAQDNSSVKLNSISFHLGAGYTSNDSWYEGSELHSSKYLTPVFGIQYTRHQLFQLKNKSISWSVLGFTHKTILTGPQISWESFSASVLVGYGMVSITSTADNSDPFNPKLNNRENYGAVGGVQLQYRLPNKWTIGGTATSNFTFTGSVGFDF